jgi:hypothetical protein
MTTTMQPTVRRASAQPRTATAQRARPPDEYDDQWPPPYPKSAIRYPPYLDDPATKPRRLGRLYLPLACFCICVGAILAMVIPPTVQQWRDNATYGYPRTYQTSANVGHGAPHSPSSHFIALNLDGVLEVIEIPGGDPASYPPQLYRLATLTGPEADLIVITVSFADINGDGKPDMVASYSGTETILFNNGKGFVPRL